MSKGGRELTSGLLGGAAFTRARRMRRREKKRKDHGPKREKRGNEGTILLSLGSEDSQLGTLGSCREEI